MIYTLTLEPAVDLYINNKNKTNYCLPGGKGINVSLMLKNLGLDSIAISLIGGKTGQYIKRCLTSKGIKTDFVKTKQPTRVNMKINCEKEIEINGKHTQYTANEYLSLQSKLLKLQKGDILVISGNFPQNLDRMLGKQTLDILYQKGITFIFDTESPLMIELVKYKPLLIKPNKSELGRYFTTIIYENKHAIKCAQYLNKLGAQNIIVSLGKDGAIFVNKDKKIIKKAYKGKVISSVAAGDSMVAGFIYKYLKTKSPLKAFEFALACGCATAFSQGLAELKDVKALLKKK